MRYVSTTSVLIFLAFSVYVANVRSTHTGSVLIGPIGDDYNYTAADPDNTKWRNIVQECNPPPDSRCHDMWVANPPGYLFSDNQACKPDIDPDSTRAGCGRDALMFSSNALNYDTAGDLRLFLTERFSPNIHDAKLCGTVFLSDNDEMMHIVGLRYLDDPGSIVRIVVSHSCSIDGWKFYLRASYVDTSGTVHVLEQWVGRVIDNDQWLDLTIDIRDDGQSACLSAHNLSTNENYLPKCFASKLGTKNGPVEVEVQYRHNERSRTDFVDFRIDTPPHGAGSVAHGTMITVADGTRIPVQNLQVGSSILLYDIRTGYQTSAIVNRVRVVTAGSTLTIHTTAGLPFRTDVNPAKMLHVLLEGTPALTPVTYIQVGDRIFHYDTLSWVIVTGVDSVFGGHHIVYDLEYDSDLEYIANGYPDCRKACVL